MACPSMSCPQCVLLDGADAVDGGRSHRSLWLQCANLRTTRRRTNLDPLFSETAAYWRDRFIDLVTATAMITMGVWIFHRAEKALSRGITSEMLSFPKYPLIYAIAAIVITTGILVGLVGLWRIATRGRGTDQ